MLELLTCAAPTRKACRAEVLQRQPTPYPSVHACGYNTVFPSAPLPHPCCGHFVGVVATGGLRAAFTGPATLPRLTPSPTRLCMTTPRRATAKTLTRICTPASLPPQGAGVTYRACAPRHSSTSTVVCGGGRTRRSAERRCCAGKSWVWRRPERAALLEVQCMGGTCCI